MAKIERGSEDVVNLFEEVRNKTSIPNWLIFDVLSNEKQKEVYKINKLNDVVEIITEGTNFAVVFNEEILEGLPRPMQEIVILECLAGVNVNDNDVVSLAKPDFSTHSGVLQKFGFDEMNKVRESIKSLYDKKKQREDEQKSTTSSN